MEVILLENVDNLGNLGDKVRVKPGYGRNCLIPGGKAAPATAENLEAFEKRRAELEKAAAEALAAAQARFQEMDGVTVVIKARAGDEGKLFGSVGTADIAQAVTDKGYPLERNEIRMPEGAFRQAGEYQVGVHLHADVDGTINVVIEAE